MRFETYLGEGSFKPRVTISLYKISLFFKNWGGVHRRWVWSEKSSDGAFVGVCGWIRLQEVANWSNLFFRDHRMFGVPLYYGFRVFIERLVVHGGAFKARVFTNVQ